MIAALAVVVFGLVLGALALPLLRRPRAVAVPPDEPPAAGDLLEEREAALAALRDLELDHQLGKLADDDYHSLHERYERRALALLRATDPERPSDGPAVPGYGPGGDGPVPAAQVPPPRLAPVLDGRPAPGPLARPAPTTVAVPSGGYRNGKDHSLGGSTPPPPARRRAAAPRARRGRFTLAMAAAVAVIFVSGVGAVYFSSGLSQSAQRAVATLEGIGPRGLALAPSGRAFLAAAGGLWTSGDGGTSWQAVGALDATLRAVALSAARPSAVYAVGPGLFARSDDGGRGWVQQPAALGALFPSGASSGEEQAADAADLRALAVSPGATERLWVVVESAGLFRSDDRGQSWTRRGATPPANATALVAVDDPAREGQPLLFLASATEGVLVSVDDGAGWAPASGVLSGALPTRRVSSLAFDADSGETATTPDGRTLRGTLYAGTDQGLFRSLDRGQTWARLPLTVAVAAVGVAGGDRRLLLVVDREGQVYRSANRGVTWDGS